ncbi:MAG TPA: hypothetical protein VFW89_08820 [Gemmatimonadaceae bacterium]|nr:hypothetical protein [Gemmatimonadaceae bacterium]
MNALLAGAIAITMVAAAIAALYYGALPARHGNLSANRLNALVTTLLNQGFNGGILRIEGRGVDVFLQVLKYVGKARSGIELDFPLAPWSEVYYPRARSVLAANNIKFEEESTGRKDTRSFVTVDFGTDVSLAVKVLQLLAADVFDLDMEHEMVAHLQGNISRNPGDRIGLS